VDWRLSGYIVARKKKESRDYNWGISVANWSGDKCSLAASQSEDQKTNDVNGGYGYGRSSCIPPGKHACSITSLTCLYTKARSMGNKQEELEVCVHHRAMISLQLQRRGGTACMTGMLH